MNLGEALEGLEHLRLVLEGLEITADQFGGRPAACLDDALEQVVVAIYYAEREILDGELGDSDHEPATT